MASELDICNLALARLGDSATVASISPPEGSAQAGRCARFYPMARDALLEMHDWKFATRRAALSQLSETPRGWSYAYALPANTLRVLAVLPGGGTISDSQDFDIETASDGTPMIVTNTEQADVRYTLRITETARFPPLVVESLSILLASYLAGPVIKGDAGKAESKAQLQVFQVMLGKAIVSNANQRHGTPEHTPVWLSDR